MNYYTQLEYCLALIIADNPGLMGVHIWQKYISNVGVMPPDSVVPTGSIYTTLSRMNKEGLVMKKAGKEDHRQALFILTPAGLIRLGETARNYRQLAKLGEKYTIV